MVSPGSSRLVYQAPLDGLRAVAILAVLGFHLFPGSFPGGFTGVNVFFVLSGFLITSLLLAGLRAGDFSLRNFYLRRIRRLLPNSLLMILSVLVLWCVFLPPTALHQPGVHGLWTLFNLSNVYAWRNLGTYWGEVAEWAPLTHTWSLAIEEQFYLLYPVGLLLLARHGGARWRTWLVAATVLGLGLWIIGGQEKPVATFYLLPTRAWELLFGAVLAAWLTPGGKIPGSGRGRLFHGVLGWTGLGTVIAGFVLIRDAQACLGLLVLVPDLAAAALIFTVTTGNSPVSRLLASPTLVHLGRRSYSLYLWHWPFLTLGKLVAGFHGWSPVVGSVFGCLVGFAMAWFAYWAVELPFRRAHGQAKWTWPAMFTGAGLAAAGCAFAALRPLAVDPGHQFDPPGTSIARYDAARGAGLVDAAASIRYLDVRFDPAPSQPLDTWRTGGIIHAYSGGLPQVVVLGSSHALMYSRLVDDLCREAGVSVAFLGADAGTSPFFEATVNPNFPSIRVAREFDEARRRWLSNWHPRAVFIIDRWDKPAAAAPDLGVRLRTFLADVSPYCHRVIWVAQVPVVAAPGINLRDYVTWGTTKGNARAKLYPDENEPLRQQAIVLAERLREDFPCLRVLRANQPFYERDGSIRYAEGRDFFYADDNHLANAGADQVKDLFRAAIAEALAGQTPD